MTKKKPEHLFYRLMPAFCQGCGSGERKHKADGLCTKCFQRRYWRETYSKTAKAKLSTEKA